MTEAAAYALALALTALCVAIHYQAMRRVPRWRSVHTATGMPVLIGVLLAAHALEIALFALAYQALSGTAFGSVQHAHTVADFLYFSAATYTTLGIGDLIPRGSLRAIAGVEALVGLLLIAWSASLVFLRMQQREQW